MQSPKEIVNSADENFSLGLLGGEDVKTIAIENVDKTEETLQ